MARIKVTENELKRIIRESVAQVLNEDEIPGWNMYDRNRQNAPANGYVTMDPGNVTQSTAPVKGTGTQPTAPNRTQAATTSKASEDWGSHNNYYEKTKSGTMPEKVPNLYQDYRENPINKSVGDKVPGVSKTQQQASDATTELNAWNNLGIAGQIAEIQKLVGLTGKDVDGKMGPQTLAKIYMALKPDSELKQADFSRRGQLGRVAKF